VNDAQQSPKRRRRATPQKTDPWQVWFFRLVQAVGLAVVLIEFYTREQPRLIAVGTGVAMMTGALGLERLVQWWTRR
jgi:hypothetical protein